MAMILVLANEEHESEKEFISKHISVITARKRSLWQGNIFKGVCQSFCPRWGAW